MPSWFEIGDLVPPSGSSVGSKVTADSICALIHTVRVTSMMAAPHIQHRDFAVTLLLRRRPSASDQPGKPSLSGAEDTLQIAITDNKMQL